MIWIIRKDMSVEAIGVNVSLKGEYSELWAERPTGKTLKIFTGTEDEVMDYKKAIDYAVQHDHKTFEME